MKVKVHLLAFVEYEVREVEIPDKEYSEDSLLETIFRYGQNDFQPKEQVSVSAGDIIELESSLYLVKSMGFKRLTVTELIDYVRTPRRDRVFFII